MAFIFDGAPHQQKLTEKYFRRMSHGNTWHSRHFFFLLATTIFISQRGEREIRQINISVSISTRRFTPGTPLCDINILASDRIRNEKRESEEV